MPHYLFYDTLQLNPGAGGVLNVSEVLLRGMRGCADEQVESVCGLHPRLLRLARRLGASRFLVEVLIYNWHELRAAVSGERVFSVFPNYYLPFALFGLHRDSIVIVHDLHYKLYPEHFSPLKRRWLSWCLRRVAASEANVVFISQTSRLDFERHFGPCRRPSVILNPVDAERAGAGAPPGPGAGQRYLIAPYHFYPHKNLVGTLALFDRMRRAGLVDWLDITGNGAAEVAQLLSDADPALRDHVRHHGLVSRARLAELYRGATAFISLSQCEGFNLSAAEAAVRGVPLLLSDIPAHRELFTGYGFFVGTAPCDLDALAGYLASHRFTGPGWPHAQVCMPTVVARRYLGLKRLPAALLERLS